MSTAAFVVSLAAIGISGAALLITWREHRWPVTERTRRAVLRLTIEPIGADADGVLRSHHLDAVLKRELANRLGALRPAA